MFDLQDNKRAGRTHFHMKDCAPGLVLKQRQKAIACNKYVNKSMLQPTGGIHSSLNVFTSTRSGSIRNSKISK